MKTISNGFQPSYSNERPPSSQGNGDKDNDLSSDPASSSFFTNDYKKHDDLKQMLDGNKDTLKLEAMKRIIGMVAKGKNGSDLFPAVVKNVVSKNIEIKKLVYVYLTRYAEEQQDLALLSISTFQRALKDPNQLIRGSALRVLSSIRVPMIIPIMMLSIREAVSDMSPYVRKAAAHAIPKLYSLDPEQKECLIGVIEKLLADKTTLVAGSAIQAFEEVCPERIDLVHKNYRKLCNLLVDVEEWGQVVIINMLTRYCRLQFVNPNQDDQTDEHRAFYSSSSSDESSKKTSKNSRQLEKRKCNQSEGKNEDNAKSFGLSAYCMDPDHRMLLRTCRPLLNSRNAAVVMAVAQLYHHCAPKSEVSTVAKALIRLLRSHKEVQYVVLTNIASMSVKQKSMFEPYLKSFYVRYNDPAHVKLLKLEILTNLGNDANISTILREFQTYVSSSDKELAAATIQSIGRCATSISEITDTCLNGLVNLLSNRNEAVVGESVIVIKKLLQMRPSEHKDIIVHMSKMVDNITVAMAKASILWLIGEYSDRVPKIAPDVLRKMAKTFVDEEDIVKLQVINLATKLSITNPKQTRLLCQYVFNLAKYDVNYDIRDRARFLRHLVMEDHKSSKHADDPPSILSKHVKKIFLAPKPVPLLESKFKDMDHFQLGTLSHVIGQKANEYQELPDWPLVAPDNTVRNVETTLGWLEKKKKTTKKEEKKMKKGFYSEEDEEGDGGSSGDEEEDSSGESSSGSDSGSSFSSSSSSSDDDDKKKVVVNGDRKKEDKERQKKKTETKLIDEDSDDADDDSSSSDEESDDDSSEEDEDDKVEEKSVSNQTKQDNEKEKSNKTVKLSQQLLLDLDDFEPMGASTTTTLLNPTPLLTPSLLTPQTTLSPTISSKPNYSNVVGSTLGVRPSKELLNRITGAGLCIHFSFPRTLPMFHPSMLPIDLTIKNLTDTVMEGIKVGNKKLGPGMKMQEFSEIAKLAAGSQVSVVLLVDFRDTTTAATFDVRCNNHSHQLSISPSVGEMIRPNTIGEKDFLTLQGKLGGMNENSCLLKGVDTSDPQRLCNRVFEVANILMVASSRPHSYFFAGKTAAMNTDVLVSLEVVSQEGDVKVRVNCEKILIGSMLIKDLKESLSSVQ